jgi:hypothetical protein
VVVGTTAAVGTDTMATTYDAAYADYLREYEEYKGQKKAYHQYMPASDDVSFIFIVAKHDKSHFLFFELLFISRRTISISRSRSPLVDDDAILLLCVRI